MARRAVKAVLIIGFLMFAFGSLAILAQKYNHLQQQTKAVDNSQIEADCQALKGSVSALQGMSDQVSTAQRNSLANQVQNYNAQCSDITGAL